MFLILFLYCIAVFNDIRVLGEVTSECRCVKPADHQVINNPCQSRECHSLMDYVHFPGNFSNNTIFIFLPGNHSLSGAVLSISHIANLTLTGYNGRKPVVQCSGPFAGVKFEDVLDINISDLQFQNCSFYHNNSYSQAIVVRYATNLTIRNLSVYDSAGYGVQIFNLRGKSQIINTIISRSSNTSGCSGGNIRIIYYETDSTSSYSLLILNSSFTSGYIPYHHCSRHEAFASGLHLSFFTTNIINVTLRNVILSGSISRSGGNMAVIFEGLTSNINQTSSVTIDNCTLSHGSALNGGGLYLTVQVGQSQVVNASYLQFSDIITINNTIFKNNTAYLVGGGLYIEMYEMILLSTGANIKISHSKFYNNSIKQLASHTGGIALSVTNFRLAEYTRHKMPQYNLSLISCHFYENKVGKLSVNDSVGGGIIFFEQNSLAYFRDVEIVRNRCTGLVLVHSNAILEGTNIISNNTGNYGGGIVLCDNSFLYLQGSALVNITHNTALSFGGGIYVEFGCAQTLPPCFFQFDNTSNKVVNLEQNLAAKSGSALYGGSIDFCYFFGRYNKSDPTKIFFQMFHFLDHTPNDTSYISSNPERACFCDVGNDGELTQNCAQITRKSEVYPGSTFQVPLVVVGQRNGSVPGIVVASNVPNDRVIQSVSESRCMNLTYALAAEAICNTTRDKIVDIDIAVQDTNFVETYHIAKYITLSLELKSCPLGFQLQTQDPLKCGCNCHPALQMLDKIECQISNMTIYKHPGSVGWFGFLPQRNTSELEIVSYTYCPFDYCDTTKTHAIKPIQPQTANSQCAFNRSGILCGGCKTNFSVLLGSSKCCNCSENLSALRVFGILALLGLAGILLVVFLGFTDITVAGGTLNSVIFYVNVVAVNKSVLLTSSSDNIPIQFLLDGLQIFISWMNLDFGIELCFYNGMTMLQKATLQFVFPLYLWCISGAVIFLCRLSFFISKYLGRNSVKVLATVILLSYAKLLRAILDALLYIPLYHSHDSTTYMWSIDGNVYYLRTQHIILFVIGVVFALLTLPYTLVLLFIKCLRKKSHMKILFWVNKLKPFFDAYTGPYKDKYHFWTGFLLMVRILLFIAIAVDTHNGKLRNITFIIGTTSILFVLTRPGLYKEWTVNLVEVLTYANLTLFAVITAFNEEFELSNNTNIIVFIGSMLFFVVGVVIYHILKKISATLMCTFMKVWLLDQRWPWMKRKQITSLILPFASPDSDEDLNSSDGELDPIATQCDVYREPLIGTTGNTEQNN